MNMSKASKVTIAEGISSAAKRNGIQRYGEEPADPPPFPSLRGRGVVTLLSFLSIWDSLINYF
jgi:hypothetical protein